MVQKTEATLILGATISFDHLGIKKEDQKDLMMKEGGMMGQSRGGEK